MCRVRALALCVFGVVIGLTIPASAEWRFFNADGEGSRYSRDPGSLSGEEGTPGIVARGTGWGSATPTSMRLADVVGDAAPELCFLIQGRAHLYTLSGELLWVSEAVGMTQIDSIIDVDGDGIKEIITIGQDPGARIWLVSSETGSILASIRPGRPSGYTDGNEIVVGDVDGDQLPEIIWSTGGGTTRDINLTEFDPDTNAFVTVSDTFPYYSNATPMQLQDFDDDGKKELVMEHYTQITYWDAENKDPTSLVEVADVTRGYTFGPTFVVDTDSDGRPELLRHSRTNNQYAYGVGLVDPLNEPHRVWGCWDWRLSYPSSPQIL